MNTEVRTARRNIIESDTHSEPTPAARPTIRIPYQAESVLFGGWGVKL